MGFYLTASWLILAQQDRREDVLRAFRSSPSASGMSGLVVGLLVLGGIVALLAVLAAILYWQQRRRRHSSPAQLFLSLCRAHRLGWKDCWWLWQLARQQHLSDPGRLFLESERFNAVQIPAALRPQLSRFQELRERLFSTGSEKKAMPSAAPSASPPSGAAMPQPAAPPVLNISPWPSATDTTSSTSP